MLGSLWFPKHSRPRVENRLKGEEWVDDVGPSTGRALVWQGRWIGCQGMFLLRLTCS